MPTINTHTPTRLFTLAIYFFTAAIIRIGTIFILYLANQPASNPTRPPNDIITTRLFALYVMTVCYSTRAHQGYTLVITELCE